MGERITWSSGAHSIRFGGDARRFVWDMLGFFQNRGYFQITSPITSRTSLADGTGDPLASFLLGTPALAQRQAGTPSMNMRQTTYDVFIQDDWRITHQCVWRHGERRRAAQRQPDSRERRAGCVGRAAVGRTEPGHVVQHRAAWKRSTC